MLGRRPTQGEEGRAPGPPEPRSVRLTAWGLLLLLPLLFYAGMILGGKEPPAPDTAAVRPLGVWAKAAERDLGATPQWIPHLFSGMPSYGSYIYTPPSPLSPLDYLTGIFPGSRGMRYYLLLLLGGFAGFVFLRRQGASVTASAVAALGFVMTPYIPGVVEAGHSTKLRALMHVPLFLLAVDLLLERPGPLTAVALALATAMLGWSNHPQILYYAGIVALLYGCGRLWSDRGSPAAVRLPKTLLWTAAGGLVAVLLLAEPTLAVREYAPYSIRGSGEGGGVSWEYATAWSFHPRELVSFLFPEFYGLKGETYFGPLPFTQSTHYFGIVFLACACAGAFLWRSRRRWVWLGSSLVLLLIGFGEHFPLLYKPFYEILPYFNKFRVPSMIYSLLPLTLAPLAAHGIDALARPRPPEKKAARGADRVGRLWILAGAAAGIALLILIVGMATKSGGLTAAGWVRPGEAQRFSGADLDALRSARWDLRITSLVRGCLLLAAFFAALAFARRLPRQAVPAVLGGLLLLDLVLIDARFMDLVDRSEVEASLKSTPEIEFLRGQPGLFRVLPTETFSSNRYVAFGIGTVGGYQPAKLKIYQDLLDRNLMFHPGVLSMLNARYVLTSEDPGHPSFRRVAEGVYEYAEARPRAWFVPAYRALGDDEAVLSALGRADFDPGSVAYFGGSGPPGLPQNELPVRSIDRVQVTPHEVSLEVGDGDQAGLLVVSEIYYPAGWTATIDGAPAEILRADHCLRAIVVPPGSHRIEMRFASRGYRMGRALNRAGGVALLLLATSGFLAIRRGRRNGG